MEQQDYYKILRVETSASQLQIKESYRKLAFEFHPDRNRDDTAAAQMKAINESYAALSDPQKRSRYDALRQTYGDSPMIVSSKPIPSRISSGAPIFSRFLRNSAAPSGSGVLMKSSRIPDIAPLNSGDPTPLAGLLWGQGVRERVWLPGFPWAANWGG